MLPLKPNTCENYVSPGHIYPALITVGPGFVIKKNALAVYADGNEVLNSCRQGLEIKPLSHLLLAKQNSYCASVTENFKDLLGLHLCSWVYWWKTKHHTDSGYTGRKLNTTLTQKGSG